MGHNLSSLKNNGKYPNQNLFQDWVHKNFCAKKTMFTLLMNFFYTVSISM
jgi:hypothetical protein